MSTRYTANGDVWKPEVVGPVIWDTVYNMLALLDSPAVSELGAKFINGGQQATFPIFQGVQGDFADLDPTDTTGAQPDVTYSKMSYETADVVSKIIDIGLNNTTLEDAYNAGDFGLVDATFEDVATKASRTVDQYLVTKVGTTSLSYTVASSGTMSRSAVIKAKTTKWGDMSRMPGIFLCHSKVYGDIQDEVKDVVNTYLNTSVNQAGTVQLYNGMPVVVSDACPVDGSSNYTSFILAPGAIGFSYVREMSYSVIQQLGDRNVHEFVLRYVSTLRRKNGKDLAIKIISK